VDSATFDRELQVARDRLPGEFRRHLDAVHLIVDDIPDTALLQEEEPPLDPELLGLFVGSPLIERSSFSGTGGDLPPRIYLFKRNLERCVAEPDELAEQIAVTLYHELGHYLGLDEEDLEELEFD
jgi:predicted Zn-dependent protease with MMP-like domain